MSGIFLTSQIIYKVLIYNHLHPEDQPPSFFYPNNTRVHSILSQHKKMHFQTFSTMILLKWQRDRKWGLGVWWSLPYPMIVPILLRYVVYRVLPYAYTGTRTAPGLTRYYSYPTEVCSKDKKTLGKHSKDGYCFQLNGHRLLGQFNGCFATAAASGVLKSIGAHVWDINRSGLFFSHSTTSQKGFCCL